jgi:hypothetical protein
MLNSKYEAGEIVNFDLFMILDISKSKEGSGKKAKPFIFRKIMEKLSCN